MYVPPWREELEELEQWRWTPGYLAAASNGILHETSKGSELFASKIYISKLASQPAVRFLFKII